MTNEQVEKAIEFILELESRSAAKIEAVAEAQKVAEERWSRTEDGIRALLAIAEMHEKDIQAHTQQITSIGETTRATDDRLNALINVVERMISERRNGHQ